MNWPIIAIVIAAAAFAGGTFFGMDYKEKQYDQMELARKSGWADALDASAKAIAKVKVTNTTINRATEKIIEKEQVYRECKNTPEMVEQINGALKGTVNK